MSKEFYRLLALAYLARAKWTERLAAADNVAWQFILFGLLALAIPIVIAVVTRATDIGKTLLDVLSVPSGSGQAR